MNNFRSLLITVCETPHVGFFPRVYFFASGTNNRRPGWNTLFFQDRHFGLKSLLAHVSVAHPGRKDAVASLGQEGLGEKFWVKTKSRGNLSVGTKYLVLPENTGPGALI